MSEDSKHATFTFGRFSPPTTGHKKLVDSVISHAKKAKGDHYVFASQTQDPKKNPLHHDEKVSFMRRFFPHTNVSDEKSIKTPIDAMKHLHARGYKRVTMVVGSDRVQEMHNLLHRYNGKDYNFDHIEVKSAGARDPDAEGVEGMSASKMRAHASAKEFSQFREGVPNPEHAEELYHAVRRGLKLESAQKHFKALFLVGGPGSGKDILIKSGLQESGMVEISLEKMYKTILEKNSLRELGSFRSVFINGNADDYNKIDVCRKVFEHMGYDTSMLFVYTENAESKRRNDVRIQSGSKTFSEEARLNKYNQSLKNMKRFSEEFSSFFLYDNSRDFRTSNEVARKEIIGWTKELFEGISDFITEAPSNPDAIKWLVESGKIDVTHINQLFEETIGESNENFRTFEEAVLGRNGRGSKKGIASDPREGGIPKSSDNRAERVVAAEAEEAKADTSKGKTIYRKQATNPGRYFDSRIGAVPSGGIGLTAYTVAEKKSFSNFRKK
jgi:hypothetical protein